MVEPASPVPDEPQRLSKVVAALVPCSRREAEQYIAEGRVRVDGRQVEEPQSRVAPSQKVEVDSQARLQPPVRATVLLHKPAGLADPQALALFAASSHWDADPSGIRYVKSHGIGLHPLLPLPTQASGLAVFSQDAGVVRKLTEEAAFIEQELVAEVAGTVASGGLERLARSLVPAKATPPKVSWQSETRLRIAGKGIDLQAIAPACAQAGLQLVALRRIRIGRVPMAGLPAGRWRYLPRGERF